MARPSILSSAHVERRGIVGAQAQALAHAGIEGAQLGVIEGVGQREHGHAVLDIAQRAAGAGAHAEGGRIGRLQLRVRGLEVAELAEEPVVLGIGQLRRVLLVVEAVGALEDLAQLRCPLRARAWASPCLGLLVHGGEDRPIPRSRATLPPAVGPLSRLPLHPLLLAAYAVLFVYAANISEVLPGELVQPLLTALLAAAVVLAVCALLFRDLRRGAVLATAIVVAFAFFGHLGSQLDEAIITDAVQLGAWAVFVVLVGVYAWRAGALTGQRDAGAQRLRPVPARHHARDHRAGRNLARSSSVRG